MTKSPSERGFYRLYRGWLDHPMLAGPYDRRSAWCWLIEHAAWKPRTVVVNTTEVQVQRGQLVASVRFLAEIWGWKRTKAHTFLTDLKDRTAIRTANRTAGRTPYTVITICNYDEYQIDGQDDRTANRTGNRTANRTIKKERKNDGEKDTTVVVSHHARAREGKRSFRTIDRTGAFHGRAFTRSQPFP